MCTGIISVCAYNSPHLAEWVFPTGYISQYFRRVPKMLQSYMYVGIYHAPIEEVE